MGGERIAIVGIGLRYPDVRSANDLWENVLAGRRALRRSDAASPDPFGLFPRVMPRNVASLPDLIPALVIDLTAEALADAGFPGGEGLPRPSTGFVLDSGTSGWPVAVDTTPPRWSQLCPALAAELADSGWPTEQVSEFLRLLGPGYELMVSPSEATGTASTTAGRVCEHFALDGGSYLVGGEQVSSLRCVVTAAEALARGDLDVALAASVNVLTAPRPVAVRDPGVTRPWPGDGAGVLVLMRERDAQAQGRRGYATITGWGVVDGSDAATRTEDTCRRLAITRAYRRAGHGPQTVHYFEIVDGPTGVCTTGTTVLSSVRRDAALTAPPAAVGSVMDNVGYAGAAAGIAGLVSATLAVHHQMIPPGTGQVHRAPDRDADMLYVPVRAELWPADHVIRAGISATETDGVSAHLVIEQSTGRPRGTRIPRRSARLVAGRQDAEVLLLDAEDHAGLRTAVDQLRTVIPTLAQAELVDLASTLATGLTDGPVRAAIVAASPEQADLRLARLAALLDTGEQRTLLPGEGVFLGQGARTPRVVFLFPGQGSRPGPVCALRRRFAAADAMLRSAGVPDDPDQVPAHLAQPRVVAGSLAALEVLRLLGIEADVAVGHSLGEMTALAWGGSLSGSQLVALAASRGEVMAKASAGGGAMAVLVAGPDQTNRLAQGEGTVIAGYHAPDETVISGPADAVDRVCARAEAAGITAIRLRVPHAFHSPMVTPAAEAMAARLAEVHFAPLSRPVVSTVTGDVLDPDTDLRALLRDQVLDPVRFHQAAARAAVGADLVVEVGPGTMLTGLVERIAPGTPALPTDTDSGSLAALLTVVAAAHAVGVTVDPIPLFADRAVRPFRLDDESLVLTRSGTARSADLSRTPPGCVVTTVVERGQEEWAAQLGAEHLPVRDRVIAESGESTQVACTRVQCALRCLTEAGCQTRDLRVEWAQEDGWVVLSAGKTAIATWVTTVKNRPAPVVFAVLAGEEY